MDLASWAAGDKGKRKYVRLTKISEFESEVTFKVIKFLLVNKQVRFRYFLGGIRSDKMRCSNKVSSVA